jgi:hypothetical protein
MDPGQLYKGAAVFAYAEALKYAKYGEADPPPVVTPAEALEAVAVAESRLPGDEDLAEIREVLEAL